MLRYFLRRDGVMASNCCEAGAFFCSRPEVAVPDLQLVTHFQTFGPKQQVATDICLLATKSRGRVFLDPRKPFGAPLVDANFLAEEEDVAALVAGLQRARSIASRAALRDFPLLSETGPEPLARDDDSLCAAIFREVTTAYHPTGTCSMGPVGTGALGPDLRVHGTDCLWVADASAMPASPSGNITCQVVVLAEKAAELIAGRTPPPAP
jgi:choline dehydrogenase